MSLNPNEFDELRKEFLETCRASGFNEAEVMTVIPEALSVDGITYIQRQLSDIARLGKINNAQYAIMLREAEIGLFELCYVKHYPHTEELYDRDPFFISCVNLQRLLFNRVLDGRDRELAIKDMDTRRPVLPTLGGK